jgi:hypothetical protein
MPFLFFAAVGKSKSKPRGNTPPQGGRNIHRSRSDTEVAARRDTAKPLADLDKTWADNDQAAANFVSQVYHSFSRS